MEYGTMTCDWEGVMIWMKHAYNEITYRPRGNKKALIEKTLCKVDF